MRPSSKMINSIRDFAAPTNISEMRAFYDMVNQVNYTFAMSEVMDPFRHLLKPGNTFQWSTDLQNTFDQAKEMIVEAVKEGVKHFELG